VQPEPGPLGSETRRICAPAPTCQVEFPAEFFAGANVLPFSPQNKNAPVASDDGVFEKLAAQNWQLKTGTSKLAPQNWHLKRRERI
jgi:hypothetical protein